ncbi:uncharacterized protein EV420DRAFT_682940 [Desarmillaria tabescens]|uniref:Uncharacterized protein n=1 Tax=Armillaria tabescens TaxID=1929756 RepID=A0AA39K3M4_ARMTA|nr:uncharacterized protein EV420DRAFT_682940 [Desarmillaria tabescens]KAK0452835.1 hypothetical protein EV420DRAFT_682940 [Desarmillaria tabescens]
MNEPMSSTKKSKQRSENSKDAITVAIEFAKVTVALGDMVPVVGGFLKGLGGVALVFLPHLERYGTNKEDAEELAKDITDVLVIVRDAVIELSAVPEGITYAEDLRKSCLEFQEFLSSLTTEVRDIYRSQRGTWKSIKRFPTSQSVRDAINGHRQTMEAAKSNLLLSLSLNSNASVSHMKHGIASLQSMQTDLVNVAGGIQRDISHITANTRKTVVNNKFHNLLHSDIQIREMWSHREVIDNSSRRIGEVIKFTADVSTLGRIMVVKEYSGSLGLVAWKQQLDIHTQVGRHPNLRQLYGVVEPGQTPSLIFYGNSGEMPLSEFPKLFEKRLEFLAHFVLTHAFHSAFRFSLTCLQLTFGFNDVRCTPDGRLLFDDLQVSPDWDKIYIKNLADLFRPAAEEIRDSLDLFMRRRNEPVMVKEHLLSYYDILSVGTSLHANVGSPLEHEMIFGKIVVSDTLSDRHFFIDSLEDEHPPVRISVISQPGAGKFLQLPSGVWRYTLPEGVDAVDFLCSMSLTTAAKRECFFHWFSQGPRILAKMFMSSGVSHPHLIVTQVTQRYFQILVETESSNIDWPPSSVPYLFIGVPPLTENHGFGAPDVYLSSDPYGARLTIDAPNNHSGYSVALTEVGHDILFHRPLGLECSTLFHKICGFHPLSIEVARYLNQSELSARLIEDEAISTEISRGISGCSTITQTASTVPWEQLKAYSDMLEVLESDISKLEDRNHDPLREAQIYEVEPDGISSSESSSITEFGSPMSRISLCIYVIGGVITVLVDSTLVRVTLLIALFLHSWVSQGPRS